MKRFLSSFAAGAGILGISSLLSRLLGVYRDHLLATTFGATAGSGLFDLDIYYAAFRLPDLLYNILILGAVSSAFVPLLSGKLARGDKEGAWSFAQATMTVLGLFLVGLSAALFFLAPFFLAFFVPGFSEDKLALTVQLTRLMLLSPIFFGLSSIAQGIENAFQRFTAYALAPILYNLAILVGVVWLAPTYGVWGVTIGVIAGAFLHFVSQIPALLRLGFRFRFLLDAARADVRRMFALMGPRVLGLAGAQAQLVVETIIASTLATGSIAILNFALNVSSLPLGVFGVSIAVAGFSTLSQHAALSAKEHFAAEFRRRMEQVLFWIVPASVGLFVLRKPIVQFLFEGGQFTAVDTMKTQLTLGLFAAGLFAYSLLPLFARAFYAWEDTRTPVFASLFSIALHIGLALFFTRRVGLGVAGLALAHAVANGVQLLLLGWLLARRLPGIFRASRRIFLFGVVALLMGALVFFVDGLLASWPLLLRLLVAGCVGAGTYFLIVRLPRHEQVGS